MMADLSKNKTGKNIQIQALRGLFCFSIIFFHLTARYSQIYGVHNIFDGLFFEYLAPFGVLSFFCLSGFYLLRRREIDSFKGKAVYWLKKFLTIYCLYLIAVIIIYVFSLTGLFGSERTVPFSEFIKNLFFLNVILGGNYVDGAHWYVFSLLMLYFIGFVYDVIPKKDNKQKPYYWFIVLSISIVSILLRRFAFKDGTTMAKLLSAINLLLCDGYFPCVFIGIAMYLFDSENIKSVHNFSLLTGAVLSIACLAIIDWVWLIILAISLLLIVLALMRKLVFLERIKPMVILGNASYSLYLLHQNIGYGLINLFTEVMNYYLALVLAFAIVILIGIFFNLFIERNLKKLISRLGSSKQAESNAS